MRKAHTLPEGSMRPVPLDGHVLVEAGEEALFDKSPGELGYRVWCAPNWDLSRQTSKQGLAPQEWYCRPFLKPDVPPQVYTYSKQPRKKS